MATPILWQSNDGRITLLDIPRSIEAAQGTTTCGHLQSVPPLESPFETNEPSSDASRARIASSNGPSELDSGYNSLLKSAVEDIHKAHSGPWNLPRLFTASKPPRGKKRKLNELDDVAEVNSDHRTNIPDRGCPHDLFQGASRGAVKTETSMESTPQKTMFCADGQSLCFSNLSTNEPTTITLTPRAAEKSDSYNFQIPPRAAFFLGDCNNAIAFRNRVQHDAKMRGLPRHKFNCILLDPPWPNSSVKRTHRTPGSTYNVAETVSDMRELLLDMRLDLLLEESGLVGVWITNKPAVRKFVLGEEGLFACCGVELVEEWIWLKTTVHGEPMTAVDAVWRKPYEVLLLGRKRSKLSQLPMEVKRRVIIAVPDLHSRKPCLKELIEPLMLDANDYRALEVFARHLIAGWWSWGNECIKFNWEGYWKSADQERLHGQNQSSLP